MKNGPKSSAAEFINDCKIGLTEHTVARVTHIESLTFDGSGDSLEFVNSLPEEVSAIVDHCLKFGDQSTKFDGLRGPDYSDGQMAIASAFQAFVAPPKPDGWFIATIAYHVNENGRVDTIDEMKIVKIHK